MIEEELNLKIENKKREFADILQVHKSAQEQRHSEHNGWLSRERDVEEKLKNILQQIHEQRFISRLNIMIRDKKPTTSKVDFFAFPERGDFSKLVYFIDRLNSINTPEYVFKKNPDYCKTVLQTIANEYLNILSYLQQLRANKEKEKVNTDRQTFLSNQSKIKQAWDDFCTCEIDGLARKKASALIHECEDAIMV